MKYIQKIMKVFKESVVSTGKYIESHSKTIALTLSVVALVITLFNTYQIKSRSVESVYRDVSGAAVAAPEKIVDEIPKDAPFLGDPKAKLTIVEFGDFQCPYCGKFFKENLPTLKSSYIDTGKVKFVYLNFAFLGQESKDAANAAYCAKEQGKFWEYHDELFKNQDGENSGAFNEGNLRKFAESIKINADEFDECLKADKYKDLIEKELQLGQKFGVNGTPTLLIGKNLIRGISSTSNMEQVINSQLK